MAQFKWTKSPSQAWSTKKLIDYIRKGSYLVLLSYAPQIQAEMVDNAPWTDRTGNARQTLSAEVYHKTDTSVALVAKGEMEYQVYLELVKKGQSILSPELQNAGKYAVILPTLEGYYSEIFTSLEKVFNGTFT